MAYEKLAENFTDGDIIYGLDSPRSEALQTLKKRGVKRQALVTSAYFCGLPGRKKTKKTLSSKMILPMPFGTPLLPTNIPAIKA